MSTNKRCRISSEHRKLIVEAFNDSKDFLQVSDDLGVNRSTARGIVARYLREGRVETKPRGGRNNVRVDDEMRQCLNEIINENSTLNLKEMNMELRRRLPEKPTVHSRTIAKAIDGMLYRVRSIRRTLPSKPVSPVIERQRVEFATWLQMQTTEKLSRCVFIATCALCIWTSRSHGKVSTGEPAVRQVCGQRCHNVNVTVAVAPENGLLLLTAIIGIVSKKKFDDFLRQVREQVDANEYVTLIYDAFPLFCVPECPGGKTELKPLPDNSPLLNMAENAVACLQDAVTKDISCAETQQLIQDREEAKRRAIALPEFRHDILLEACRRNYDVITKEKCAEWFNSLQDHVRHLIEEAGNGSKEQGHSLSGEQEETATTREINNDNEKRIIPKKEIINSN